MITKSLGEYPLLYLDMQSPRSVSETPKHLETLVVGKGCKVLSILPVLLPTYSYIFLKYLPKFTHLTGTGTDMLLYLRAQNAQL
jgi:hypothetical protein